ncbi:hypothetical protein FRUB_03830 [Fimbriiglobus ruber]|uniref:SD-repeat containing protein B domain-containing protein n=1 Tax=Fimbriiglobus ruber TaxID=1908690 RepID=A0A225DK55_9BACT|nr:hypothetical protein FRUB_03830 [Fimbriiglobus ruber]
MSLGLTGSTSYAIDGSSGTVNVLDDRAQVNGQAWMDNDGDGVEDAGDTPVVGDTVQLLNTSTGDVVGTTTTDRNGNYQFVYDTLTSASPTSPISVQIVFGNPNAASDIFVVGGPNSNIIDVMNGMTAAFTLVAGGKGKKMGGLLCPRA